MFLLDYCRPNPKGNRTHRKKRNLPASRRESNALDTDSILPPLLLLAASLLLFAWASIAVATRRRRPILLALLDYSPAPGIGILRAVSASAAGISAVAIGDALTSQWPVVLLLLAALVATVAVLVLVHFLADRWAVLFPDASRWLARPRLWFSNSNAAPVNGDTPAANSAGGPDYANGDGNGNPDIPPLTPAEILNLDNYDINMVRSISRMDDRDVLDIMVPRLDVDAVPATASFQEIVHTFVASRHTRLPVYNDTMDNVVGILHISDVLNALANNQTHVELQSLMREPEFVAENMHVDDLLRLLRSKSLQMAIVVDEYGGVEGMVTLEDVLEEIVGEIEDEFADYDEDDVPILADDGSWLASATVPVEAVARALGVRLDHYDVNTIGGYVYTKLGRMPAVGDVIVGDEVSIEVTEVSGRRIHQLRLTPNAAGDRETGPPAA